MVQVAYKTAGGFESNGYGRWGCFAPLMSATGIRHYLDPKSRDAYETIRSNSNMKENPYAITYARFKPTPGPQLTFEAYENYRSFIENHPYFKPLLGRRFADGSYRANPKYPLDYTISAWCAMRAVTENTQSVLNFVKIPELMREYRIIYSDNNILFWAMMYVRLHYTKDGRIIQVSEPMNSHSPIGSGGTVEDMVRLKHNWIEITGAPMREKPIYSGYVHCLIPNKNKGTSISKILWNNHTTGKMTEENMVKNLVELREQFNKIEHAMLTERAKHAKKA